MILGDCSWGWLYHPQSDCLWWKNHMDQNVKALYPSKMPQAQMMFVNPPRATQSKLPNQIFSNSLISTAPTGSFWPSTEETVLSHAGGDWQKILSIELLLETIRSGKTPPSEPSCHSFVMESRLASKHWRSSQKIIFFSVGFFCEDSKKRSWWNAR